MKTKRYRLNITPRQVKVVPPKVKIEDATQGLIRIWTTKNTTLGKYELSLESEGHATIVMNVEVTDKNPNCHNKK